ncbi:hypothetical protein ACTNEO_14990 [Gracilibacillus sp. HCP3S3_G5_1]|uniref:hypothetical protein n=1 Tax=unclassified Gracilibacillus TaxID=2625209 RepID=UPI003F8CAB67
MWKDSWWIATKELKLQVPGVILTLLVTIFIAFLATPTIYSMVLNIFDSSEIYANRITFENRTFYIDSMITDFIFLGLTPSFSALFMWGPYISFRTMKEDPFSKRLAVYRILPVSTKTLTASRIFFMLSVFLLFTIAFYLTIFLAIPATFFDYFGYDHFFFFILFWVGYALVLGSLNMYVESGTNGKVLYIYSFINAVCLIILLLLLYLIWGVGVVEATILLISKYPVTPAIVSLICSILVVLIIAKLLNKRLAQRNYL